MSNFAVLHVSKSSGGGCGALGRHIDRSHCPKNADKAKAHLNKIFIDHGKSLDRAIANRIKAGYKKKAKIRSNAVKALNIVMTGSHKPMKQIEANQVTFQEWVTENYRFLVNQYGKENIVSFALHRDEKTPHLHAVVVPLTSDGRLSAREVVGNKNDLKRLQDDYAASMKPFGLMRGIEGKRARHENVMEYYQRLEKVDERALKHLEQIEIPAKSIWESKDGHAHRVKKHLEPLTKQITTLMEEQRRMEQEKIKLYDFHTQSLEQVKEAKQYALEVKELYNKLENDAESKIRKLYSEHRMTLERTDANPKTIASELYAMLKEQLHPVMEKAFEALKNGMRYYLNYFQEKFLPELRTLQIDLKIQSNGEYLFTRGKSPELRWYLNAWLQEALEIDCKKIENKIENSWSGVNLNKELESLHKIGFTFHKFGDQIQIKHEEMNISAFMTVENGLNRSRGISY